MTLFHAASRDALAAAEHKLLAVLDAKPAARAKAIAASYAVAAAGTITLGIFGGLALAEADAASLATGSRHNCVVVESGGRCWGANYDGQLGNGDPLVTTSAAPIEVIGL